jgi:hypothetical protein
MMLGAAADDAAIKIAVRRIGPALVSERLWEETGCRAAIAIEAMLCYKQLWTVEQTFRTAKHLFSTRPIFHKLDETIHGPRVLQLPRPGAEVGTGGPHCRVRPIRLLAGNHRQSGFAHRDRDRAGRQALHCALRSTPRRQPRYPCGRRCAAAHRARRSA